MPNNGAILIEKKVSINEGDTVFDVLVKVTKMQKIQVSSIGGYIQSINNLPEKCLLMEVVDGCMKSMGFMAIKEVRNMY